MPAASSRFEKTRLGRSVVLATMIPHQYVVSHRCEEDRSALVPQSSTTLGKSRPVVSARMLCDPSSALKLARQQTNPATLLSTALHKASQEIFG